ncbi:MAG TPA: hypothetical protein EYN66_24790 [Myxococcales bacterium]|nr:hypothetical protein [Myxococcales bacterium]
MTIGSNWKLQLESEVAMILGETDLGASPDAEQHQVMQLAGAFRADLNGPLGGVGFTALFASGDNNLGDDKQTGFKADSNFDMGMLLFPYVIAAQTARAPVTAANPDLVGVPAQDRERIPTRGSVTNTWAFFPKAWVRPLDGLELYAGALMALSNVDNADPFNTRLAGGDPRNAVNEDPGSYYGTEFDLGLRYSALLWGTTLQLGVEGAVLLPGSALGLTDMIMGGRAMAVYQF